VNGRITTGTILRTNTVSGTFQVELSDGSKEKMAAVSLIETAASIYGVRGKPTYAIDTPVLVFVPNRLTEGIDQAVIIGAFNVSPIVEESPLSLASVLDFPVAFLMNRPDTDMDTAPETPPSRQNHNPGALADILPGEFSKNTLFGGGIFINDHLASLRANVSTGIDLYNLTNTLRIYSDRYQQFLANSERYVYAPHKNTRAVYFRDNPSCLSRLGAHDGSAPLEEKEGEIYPVVRTKDTDIYTRQHLSGATVEGDLDVWGHVDELDTVKGSVSEFKGHNGTYAVRALRDISLTKTSVIPVPQLKPGVVPGKKEKMDTYEADSEEVDKFEEDASICGALAAQRIDDAELTHKFYKKLQGDEDTWDIEDIADSLDTRYLEDPILETLPPDEAFYVNHPTREIVSGTDDHGAPEGTEKVTDATSFIKLMPDGSVVISGSFGEEIRMFRGNIYMTCPGDIIKTPGRDEVGLAGRNNIIKGNKGTVELEGKIVSAVSNTSMQLVSGTSKAGGLLIENKSKGLPDDTSYEEGLKNGTGAGSGIVLRAEGTVIASDTFYVTPKKDKCNVVIRASSYYNESDNIILHGNDSASLFSDSSLITVAGSGIIVAGSAVGVNASMSLSGSSFSHPITGNNTGVSGKASLQLSGDLNVGDIACRGHISSSKGGMVGKIEDISELLSAVNDVNPGADMGVIDAPPDVSVKDMKTTMPEKLYTKLRLPTCRWQTMMSSEQYWNNIPVDDTADMFAYPGKESLEDSEALQTLSEDGTLTTDKLKDKLVINAK
jgi:hypothetical protein